MANYSGHKPSADHPWIKRTNSFHERRALHRLRQDKFLPRDHEFAIDRFLEEVSFYEEVRRAEHE